MTAMNKFESPIKTEVNWNLIDGSSISFLGETDKAYLAVISTPKRRGTSNSFSIAQREQWIPKSVWADEKNFKEYKLGGDGAIEKAFIPPFFLR